MEFLCTAASEPSGEGGARNNKRLKPKKNQLLPLLRLLSEIR